MIGIVERRRRKIVVWWGSILLFLSLLSICSCEESSSSSNQESKLPDTLTRPLSSLSSSPLAKQSFWKRAQAKQTEYERGMQLRKGTDGHEIDLQEAVQLLEAAGEAGNDEALFALGEIYEMGELGYRNFTLAFQYYNRSASYGNAAAQRNVAFMYDIGRGTPVDKAKSVLYYSFAALSKDKIATLVLGYKYTHGYGVRQSCAKAVKYYSTVAAEVIKTHLTGLGMTFGVDLIRLSDFDGTRDRSSEHQDVVQYYQFAAEAGDRHAQVTLGNLFVQGGYGVYPNYALARYYFQQAANQGDPGGLAGLGFLHLHGFGVEQDNETALKNFRQAAEKNHANALTNLAFMYIYGYGVPIDYKTALNHLREAAKIANHHEAYFYLGLLHYNGWGVKKDETKAANFFMNSASHDNAMATYYLAHIHQHTEGPRSCHEALGLYKRVAEVERWDSILEKAYIHFEQGDIDAALTLYERAAEMGFELAQSNAAYIYDSGQAGEEFLEGSNRYLKALHYYRLAADQHSRLAHLKMGDYYYYGHGGLKVDFERSVHHYKSAAELRDPQALFNLGYMHEWGLGLPQDFHLAKRNFDMALEFDHRAYVPVTIALYFLKLHDFYQNSLSEFLFEGALGKKLEEADMESILLAFLGAILAVAILYRQRQQQLLQQLQQLQQQQPPQPQPFVPPQAQQ